MHSCTHVLVLFHRFPDDGQSIQPKRGRPAAGCILFFSATGDRCSSTEPACSQNSTVPGKAGSTPTPPRPHPSAEVPKYGIPSQGVIMALDTVNFSYNPFFSAYFFQTKHYFSLIINHSEQYLNLAETLRLRYSGRHIRSHSVSFQKMG